eukprot:2617112-Karenia_brevis.AAC.1
MLKILERGKVDELPSRFQRSVEEEEASDQEGDKPPAIPSIFKPAIGVRGRGNVSASASRVK